MAVDARDCKIRVFHFKTGRLICTIDESIEQIIRVQEAASKEDADAQEEPQLASASQL